MAEVLAAQGRLAQLVFGGMAAHVVGQVTRWRLSERIGDGDRGAAELADELGTPEHTTVRVLRAAAALGILSEPTSGRFALTEAGAQLRADHPMSLYAVARVLTDPLLTAAWLRLPDSVHTGLPAFDDLHGTDLFAHLRTESELSALFNAAMGQGTREVAATLPQHYDFSRFETVLDIGGGDGTMLSAILGEHPTLRGILFDTAEGGAQAAENFRAAGVAGRCTVETGDFFTAVPDGADLHLLKSVVHDWPDDQVVTILRHCRRALPDDGRLLIVESVLPDTVDGNDPYAYLNDLNMLVNLGGRERTQADFERVCARAGFTVTGVTRLLPYTMTSCIEAEPGPA
ncbi:methyltransferase [Amycolatopsis sp. A1MSW2902]